MMRAIIILCLIAGSVSAQGQPPGAQRVDARFRHIASIDLIDDFDASAQMQHGEKIWVKDEGAFVWDKDLATAADNITIFNAGVIGGRFVREPVGEALQYTTVQRNLLRYRVGKSHLVHDTDDSKLWIVIGQGVDTAPLFIDATGGNDLGYTAAVGSGQVTIAGGTSATLPAADASTAGLMLPAEKSEIGYHQTLFGMPSTSTHFGTFTGTTLTDNLDAKALFQEIEDAIEASGAISTNLAYTPSPTVGIVTSSSGDDATIPAADGVNSGLILPGEKAQISTQQTALGIGALAVDFGVFPGELFANNQTAYLLFAATESAIEDHTTLSGVAAASEDLGTFTGTTIADSQTIKQALQALETATEAATGGNTKVENLQWSVVGATGTVTLAADPADPEEVRFIMRSGLTYTSTAVAAPGVNVTLSGAGNRTATIDAGDFGVEDNDKVLVIYE